MAYNAQPANANNVGSVAYDHPQFITHEFEQGMVGLPHIAASGSSTGNGNYAYFTAPCNCVVYQTTFTTVVAGTGAGSTVNCGAIIANNGANVSNTIYFQNVITTGTNAAGNIFLVEYGYNVSPNGANSGSNTVAPGGFYLNAASTLFANQLGNTLCLSTATEWRPVGNAVFHT